MQPNRATRSSSHFTFRLVTGWVISIALCVIPVILWASMNHYFAKFNSFYGVMSSLGELAGLVGMIMYALNFVYATRLKFIEDWFGGLNRVYIAHHILGGLAVVLLALHPLFLMLRSITTSARESALLILPHDLTPIGALFNTDAPEHYIVLQQWAILFGTIAFIGMVILLILTFYIKLPYKLWLFTHKFLGLAFFIAGLHVLFVSSDTSINGPLKYYILGATAIGLAAYIYRTLLGNILIRRYRYRVDGVKMAGGGVVQIALNPLNIPFTYKPGQFVFVRFLNTGAHGITTEWHPFSISSTPQDPYIELSIKALGDYTTTLGNIRPGAIAEVEDAYGRFSYTNFQNKNQIWIAGGIGITPFLSMARNLLADTYFQIDLYYCVKNASELIEPSKLAEVAQLSQNRFRVIPYITKTEGVLTADIIESKSGSLVGKEIFICGPPPMMKALKSQLRKKGIPPSVIHSEEFAMT